jgi:myosin heavy subunit
MNNIFINNMIYDHEFNSKLDQYFIEMVEYRHDEDAYPVMFESAMDGVRKLIDNLLAKVKSVIEKVKVFLFGEKAKKDEQQTDAKVEKMEEVISEHPEIGQQEVTTIDSDKYVKECRKLRKQNKFTGITDTLFKACAVTGTVASVIMMFKSGKVKKQLKNAMSELEQSKNSITKLKSELDKSASANTALSSELNKQKTTNNDLKTKIADLEKQISDKNQEITQLKKDNKNNPRITELENEVKDLKTQVKNLTEENKGNVTRLDTAKHENTGLKNNLKKSQEEVNNLHQEVLDLKGKLQTEEQKVVSLTTEIEGLKRIEQQQKTIATTGSANNINGKQAANSSGSTKPAPAPKSKDEKDTVEKDHKASQNMRELKAALNALRNKIKLKDNVRISESVKSRYLWFFNEENCGRTMKKSLSDAEYIELANRISLKTKANSEEECKNFVITMKYNTKDDINAFISSKLWAIISKYKNTVGAGGSGSKRTK